MLRFINFPNLRGLNKINEASNFTFFQIAVAEGVVAAPVSSLGINIKYKYSKNIKYKNYFNMLNLFIQSLLSFLF